MHGERGRGGCGGKEGRRRCPWWRITLAAAIILAIVAGCSGDGGRNRHDRLIIAFSSEPNRTNPVFLSDLNSYTVSGWIFNGLTKTGDDLKVAPDLARSWRIEDNGLEITFFLRKGVKWHDGTEFTARDVLFTYRQAVDPGNGSPHSARFGPVKDVTAPDPHTVRVRYERPYGSALSSWSLGIIPRHHFEGRDGRDTAFDEKPIGTGPYRLRQWVRGEHLSLEANETYFDGPPKIGTVMVRFIPDSATRMLEFKKGTIDLMEANPTQFDQVLGNSGEEGRVAAYRSPSFRYAFLGFNLRDSRFEDRRVRQAISHGIDKDALIKTVLRGLGGRSTGPYPPGAPYAGTASVTPAYSKEKASALLAEAGWQRGERGILYKGGRPFSFVLATNAESEENMQTAQVLQGSLRELGIDVTVRQLEWQTFRHRVIQHHDFEAVLLSRAYLWDPDLFDLWHSSRTKEGEWNFLSYRSKAADRLLEKGRAAVDEGQRFSIYRRLHEVIALDQPCVFLYNADGLFLARKDLKGITPSPLGIYHHLHRFFYRS